jgi:hypothetical protein
MTKEPCRIEPASSDRDTWWVLRGQEIVAVALTETHARRLCEEANGHACRCTGGPAGRQAEDGGG